MCGTVMVLGIRVSLSKKQWLECWSHKPGWYLWVLGIGVEVQGSKMWAFECLDSVLFCAT